MNSRPFYRNRTVAAVPYTRKTASAPVALTYLAGGVLWSALELGTRSNQRQAELVFFVHVFISVVCVSPFLCYCNEASNIGGFCF